MARKREITPLALANESFRPMDENHRILSGPEAYRAMIEGRPVLLKGVGFGISGGVMPPLKSDARIVMNLALCCIVSSLPANTWTERVEPVLNEYQVVRFTELHAPREADVKRKIGQIETAARRLKIFLDLEDKPSPVCEAALRRIGTARHHRDDGKNLHDELYPGLSLLMARISALKGQKLTTIPDSLTILIQSLNAIVISLGGRVGISKSMADEGRFTPFTKLVHDALQCSSLEAPCALTPLALTKAIAKAKRQRD